MTITLTREEAQQVLDALLWRAHANPAHNPDFINDAIAFLRARLAQPEPEPEPLAWDEVFDAAAAASIRRSRKP